ncbi:uncharacterized protein WCC33_005406 [Rhinophrynus dorsalis]
MGIRGIRMIFLLLMALLLPNPGNSQFGVNANRCKCGPLRSPPPDNHIRGYLEKVKDYEECAENIIRFNFQKGGFCAHKTEEWVQKMKNCLDKGKSICLNAMDSKTHLENSKGSVKSPTTIAATKRFLQTTSDANQPQDYTVTQWAPTVTSQIPTVTEQGPTSIPYEENEPDKDSRKLRDPGPTPVNPNVENKMKSMKTAIGSLLGICILLVAVVTFFWCRRRKTKNQEVISCPHLDNESNNSCTQPLTGGTEYPDGGVEKTRENRCAQFNI